MLQNNYIKCVIVEIEFYTMKFSQTSLPVLSLPAVHPSLHKLLHFKADQFLIINA